MIALSPHRKILTLLVTAAVTYALNRLGLDATELGVTDWAEPIVDFLLVIAVPAVFTWAQPNEEWDSIWRYWRAILVGLGLVALAIAAVVVAV